MVRTLTATDTKARMLALLDEVAAGDEVAITNGSWADDSVELMSGTGDRAHS